MIRILFVSRVCLGHGGGGGMEFGFHALADRLKSLGYEVSILTTPGIVRQDLMSVFDNVWCVKRGRPGKYSMWWWLSTFRHGSLRRWNPDLVISVSSAGAAAMLGNSDLVHVAQCHGTGVAEVRSSIRTGGIREYAKVVLNSLRVLREIPSYRCFQKVWVVSNEVENQLLKFPYSVSGDKIEKISNGVDVDFFTCRASSRTEIRSGLNIEKNSAVGITLSQLNVQKGVDLAIAALAESSDRQRVLIVAGDGPARDDLVKLSVSLGVSDRVRFVGHLDRGRVPDYLSAADVMVFPTRRVEGLPFSLLEALASGLPLVTTSGCNVPSDLGSVVTLCETTGRSVAQAWGIALAKATGERKSMLPEEYSTTYMSRQYDVSIRKEIELGRATYIDRDIS